MTTILLIHGINNQDNSKENIERTWSDALKSRIDATELTMLNNVKFIAAFYGDLLVEEAESWEKIQPTSSPMGVSSSDDDYADNEVASLYIEFQQKYGISDAQVAKELDDRDNLQAQKPMAKGIHKSWIKAIVRALEKALPSGGGRVAKAFLIQAAAYLHKPGLKEKVDDLVMEQIIAGLPEDEKVVIISHSLGTVVAYDLMRRLRHKVKVKLLLTTGSPLGIEIVKRRLGPPLICLPNVEKWVNVSDEEDFVALQTELTETTFGCGNIKNISHLDNGNEDAHDILKYLAHDVVAKEIVSNL